MARIGKVLIVGGGIGGMCTAIALRQRGVTVELIDIDSQWRALGAGLTLNGATLRALAELGLSEKVARAGHLHGGRRILDSRGNILFDEPAFRPAADDVSAWGGILRPRLHALLADEVLRSDTSVRLGLTVASVEQRSADIGVAFSDGTTGVYDLVIGADGITSHMRSLIFPDAPKPAFTGQGCWRAVFDRPASVAASHIYVDPGKKLGLNPVSDQKMYMFMLESAPGNPWREPSGWIAELAARLRTYAGLPLQLAEALNDESMVNYRPLETLLLPPPWHNGRVVLIGDAAHATTPHAGFGAGLAVEDALLLGRYLDTAAELDDALSAFTARRFPRCRAIIEASLALGELEMSEADSSAQTQASANLFAISREPC